MVKVWNITDEELEGGKRQVSMVTSRDLGVVRILSFISVPLSLIYSLMKFGLPCAYCSD